MIGAEGVPANEKEHEMSTNKITATVDAIATASDVLAAFRGESVSDATSETRTADALALLRARTDGATVSSVEESQRDADNLRQSWLDALRSVSDRRADLALAMLACSVEGMTNKSIGERYGADASRVTLWLAFGAWLANGGASKAPSVGREAYLSDAWGALDQAKRNGLLSSESVAAAVGKGAKGVAQVAQAAVRGKAEAVKRAAEAEAKAAAEAEAARVAAEAEAAEAAEGIAAEAAEILGESYDPADTLTADMLAAIRESHDATMRVAACVRLRGADLTVAEAEMIDAYVTAMAETLAAINAGAAKILRPAA